MATDTRFEDLPNWQEARRLYGEIVAITQCPQLSGEFRYCFQMKAAAGSVMDNIAGGVERDRNLEFINHRSFAKGSLGEVRSQLYRAVDESCITPEEQVALNDKFQILANGIAGLIRYLNQTEIKGLKFKDRNQKS